MAEVTDRPAIAHYAVAEAEVAMAQETLSDRRRHNREGTF
jgi:hypothetical protein